MWTEFSFAEPGKMSGEGGVRENQNFQIAGIWYDLSGLCTEGFLWRCWLWWGNFRIEGLVEKR